MLALFENLTLLRIISVVLKITNIKVFSLSDFEVKKSGRSLKSNGLCTDTYINLHDGFIDSSMTLVPVAVKSVFLSSHIGESMHLHLSSSSDLSTYRFQNGNKCI